jgi:Integrase core domain
MDFVSDCVSTGKVIRMLTMVYDCTRECPAIEVDSSLGGWRVRRVLDRVAAERGLPEAIVLDKGPEFRGRALAAWSEERGVRLEFIQPGKPVQNAYVSPDLPLPGHLAARGQLRMRLRDPPLTRPRTERPRSQLTKSGDSTQNPARWVNERYGDFATVTHAVRVMSCFGTILSWNGTGAAMNSKNTVQTLLGKVVLELCWFGELRMRAKPRGSCLPGFPCIVERRRSRHSHSEASQSGVRETAVSGSKLSKLRFCYRLLSNMKSS